MPNRRTEAARTELLPAIIDQLARDEPDTLWGEYPVSTRTLEEGYKQLSYKQFANAVNGVANQIETTLGKRDTGEPLAFLAANDPRCAIALVAAMKAGFHASHIKIVSGKPKLFVLMAIFSLQDFPHFRKEQCCGEYAATQRPQLLCTYDNRQAICPCPPAFVGKGISNSDRA